eukprot:297886-Karenia_brevis.AAC.1
MPIQEGGTMNCSMPAHLCHLSWTHCINLLLWGSSWQWKQFPDLQLSFDAEKCRTSSVRFGIHET